MSSPRRSLKSARTPIPGQRVAIYCRKSTSRGLEQEFNSLDAQREAVEAYVRSQAGEGWAVLPERYDDGGFSGSTTERPAFQRLMEDVADGRIDVVAVYKADRLSRSLVDFTKTMEEFQRLGVAFVSVTQRFDTSDSMGRMILNMLATFAQFERDMISERTKDKIAATRRRGLWTGGHPSLGYDCVDKRLVIVEEEAARVREIFRLYLRLGSLGEVVNELRRRGWRNKDRVTNAGRMIKGAAFDKSKIRHLLTSVVYRGKIPYGDEVFDGQHEAIIDEETWDAVQAQLRVNRRGGGSAVRNKWGMLLRGLLRCHGCGQEMGHSYSKRETRRYHYYICQSHKLPGEEKCPSARAPARELEKFVVDRIRKIGQDPRLVAGTLKAARDEAARQLPDLKSEKRRIRAELQRLGEERKQLLAALARTSTGHEAIAGRIAELDGLIETLEERGHEVQVEMLKLEAHGLDEERLRAALIEFDEVWAELLPRERSRILALLIQDIRFDGPQGEVHINFRPGGVRQLAEASA